MKSTKGKVFLVGSGPGDVELLTMKAYRLITEADVIVYDRLVSEDILKLFSPKAKTYYVGKKESEHTLPQEEINQLLAHLANQFEKVVRLKGGDPFVFGRGGEEVEVLIENNIPFEIVPGISSSIAAASYAGIPVTHRGIATNFTVVTGHTCKAEGLDELKWGLLAETSTLVVLMGIKNKKIIARKLIENGKKCDTPVAFVENGTRKNQKVIISSLQEVLEKDLDVISPAVMIIGNVVNCHKSWNWFGKEEDLFGEADKNLNNIVDKIKGLRIEAR